MRLREYIHREAVGEPMGEQAGRGAKSLSKSDPTVRGHLGNLRAAFTFTVRGTEHLTKVGK